MFEVLLFVLADMIDIPARIVEYFILKLAAGHVVESCVILYTLLFLAY